ncbi:MAG: 3-isopropylmalate dehydratase, partial [Burkholderiales bacterium]
MSDAREGPRSLFEKLWDAHCVTRFDDGSDLLAVDVLFLHERTGSVALESLQASGRSVRHPERVWCTMDHIVNTRGDAPETLVPNGQAFLDATRRSTRAAGIRLLDLDSVDRGIVHVVSPELGIVHPGHLLVCPDSHTCSQGALGALAWGIGSTEAEQVLATQTLRASRPANLRVCISGEFAPAVSAKDLALFLIARFGAAGAAGRAIEFTGEAVRAMSIEARLTLCNLAVEFGAFTAIIAPDATTFAYLQGRRHAPARRFWDEAPVAQRLLASDEDAVYDENLELDTRTLPPMLCCGLVPQLSMGGRVR